MDSKTTFPKAWFWVTRNGGEELIFLLEINFVRFSGYRIDRTTVDGVELMVDSYDSIKIASATSEYHGMKYFLDCNDKNCTEYAKTYYKEELEKRIKEGSRVQNSKTFIRNGLIVLGILTVFTLWMIVTAALKFGY